MAYLQPSAQVILVVIFALGGGVRFFQPIEVLAKRMRWVSYFKPPVVRSIALVEVICGVGILLHFLFPSLSFSFLPALFRLPAPRDHDRGSHHPFCDR